MLRLLVLGLALAAPSYAALLFTGTAFADGSGRAALTGSGSGPGFASSGSVWVRSEGGGFIGSDWSVAVDYTKLWWDPFGAIDPETDEFVPTITGNNYFETYDCSVSPGTPACSSRNLTATLLTPRLLRIDLVAPLSFDRCAPVFTGDTSDCAFLYETPQTSYDLSVASDGDITIGIYDGNPVPEPASWVMMIAGFSLVAVVQRRRQVAMRA